MSEFAAKIEEAIARGRAHAESLMRDTVRVWRDTGESTTDP